MCREGTGRGILFSMYFNCLILSGVRNYLGRIRCRCAGNLNDTVLYNHYSGEALLRDLLSAIICNS